MIARARVWGGFIGSLGGVRMCACCCAQATRARLYRRAYDAVRRPRLFLTGMHGVSRKTRDLVA